MISFTSIKQWSNFQSYKNIRCSLRLLFSDFRNSRSKSLVSTQITIPTTQKCVKLIHNNFSIKGSTETMTLANDSKSTFQQMLNFRKKQAQSSILLQLSSKDDIPYAVNSCEKFGKIINAFSYNGESENVFLLLEFENEDCVRKLQLSSTYKNIADAFPVLNRIIGFTKQEDKVKSEVSVNVIDGSSNATSLQDGTISDLIQNVYRDDKLTELNHRVRFFFCCIVNELFSGPFPFCDAIPFGSTVNGTGRKNCDLDLMIRLYPEEIKQSDLHFVNKTCVGDIQNLQKRTISAISLLLHTFSPGVSSVKPILHARVPIVKLHHRILGVKADISVNNMASVLMSELLYFWGDIDPRVRPLMYAVKKWAREASITYEAPGVWITNFSLMLLVVFFLQNRPQPILPPMVASVNIKGAEFMQEYKLEYLLPLKELQDKAALNKESLATLLVEFLSYLGSHPFEYKVISLFTGTTRESNSGAPIHIQYPFEEGLNVSKNVSDYELHDTCEKARASAHYLSSHIAKNTQSRDLSVLLGIPNIHKLGHNKSKRLDVSSLLSEDASRKEGSKKSGKRRAF